ncbi:hypothetical protein MCAMS1_02809 [biofilm metagenome]
MAIIHRISLTLILCAFNYCIYAAPPPQCSTEAKAQAKKLLEFHVGKDDRIEIDSEVSALASVRNPANKKQQFAVLEVWGYIYKGNYRMRFMYYRPVGSCTLMGQEILEFANL